jgi:hypothetical protein
MASQILSAFPKPPTHIPTNPHPTSPSPTPSQGRKSVDSSSKDKRRSRGSSFTSRSDGLPRMSTESIHETKTTTPIEASLSHSMPDRPSLSKEKETSEFGERRRDGSRLGQYENLRRSLHKDSDGNSSRGSHYRDSGISQGTLEGSSGSSGHSNLITPQTPSALSSRPASFIGRYHLHLALRKILAVALANDI